MGKYTSLSKAINDLSKKGYNYNFNMKEEFIECPEKNCQLKPEEFEIDENTVFKKCQMLITKAFYTLFHQRMVL